MTGQYTCKQIDLYIDNRYVNVFERMEEFVKYYGLLCSTLNIKEINYSLHNDDSVSVRIITIEKVLEIMDYGIEKNI